MKNKRLFGNTLLLLTAMIWGFAFILQRTGMEYIGPVTFTALRTILSAIVLLPLILALDKIAQKKGTLPSKTMKKEVFMQYKKDTLKGGLICASLILFANTFQQIGLVNTSAGKAGFITALYILLVPFLDFLIFKNKPSLMEGISAILGTFGLGILCLDESFTISSSDIYLLLCSFLFALFIIACDRYANKTDVVRLTFIEFLSAGIILLIAAIILEHPTWQQIRPALIGILYCGIFSGGLGYTFQIIGQKYSPPTEATLIMCLESVFSLLFGWLFLKENLSFKELLGCGIMFFAIIIVNLQKK